MIDSITNYEFQISNFRAYFRLIVFLCVFTAGNAFAQTQSEPNLTKEQSDLITKRLYFQSVFEKGTVEEKRSALFEIRNLKSEIFSETAIPALRDSNEIVRATAAFAVIYLPKDEAFNALSPNLQDKSEIVRRETAYALGKVQNPQAVQPLMQLFQKDKISEVKNAAIVGLGEIGDVSAIDALTRILQGKPKKDDDADEFLRRSAARAVGQIAQIIQIKNSYVVTPENFMPEKYKLFALEKYQNLSAQFPQFRGAVAVLIRVLQNSKESDDARREAAFALGAIGDKTAIPVLQANLNAKDNYLAEICRESLKKLQKVADSAG